MKNQLTIFLAGFVLVFSCFEMVAAQAAEKITYSPLRRAALSTKRLLR